MTSSQLHTTMQGSNQNSTLCGRKRQLQHLYQLREEFGGLEEPCDMPAPSKKAVVSTQTTSSQSFLVLLATVALASSSSPKAKEEHQALSPSHIVQAKEELCERRSPSPPKRQRDNKRRVAAPAVKQETAQKYPQEAGKVEEAYMPMPAVKESVAQHPAYFSSWEERVSVGLSYSHGAEQLRRTATLSPPTACAVTPPPTSPLLQQHDRVAMPLPPPHVMLSNGYAVVPVPAAAFQQQPSVYPYVPHQYVGHQQQWVMEQRQQQQFYSVYAPRQMPTAMVQRGYVTMGGGGGVGYVPMGMAAPAMPAMYAPHIVWH